MFAPVYTDLTFLPLFRGTFSPLSRLHVRSGNLLPSSVLTSLVFFCNSCIASTFRFVFCSPFPTPSTPGVLGIIDERAVPAPFLATLEGTSRQCVFLSSPFFLSSCEELCPPSAWTTPAFLQTKHPVALRLLSQKVSPDTFSALHPREGSFLAFSLVLPWSSGFSQTKEYSILGFEENPYTPFPPFSR